MSAAVATSPKGEEVDVFFNAWLSSDDKSDLNDAVKKSHVLVFPGVILGYADAETANTKSAGTYKGVELVKFKVKAKAVSLAGGKVLAIHRLFA